MLTTDSSNDYGSHPWLGIDRGCQGCGLGRGEAVGGAGPDDLDQVKLIVISDHPGHYETKAGYPFYDNTLEREQRYQSALSNRKKKSVYQPALRGSPNAGCMIRDLILEELGLSSYDEVWMTNALKCDRKDKAPNRNTELKPCVQKWLVTELLMLTKYNPTTPILIAGTLAWAGFRFVDPTIANTLPVKLEETRRRLDMRWGDHPIITTYNPVMVSDCVPKIEKRVSYSQSEKPIVETVKDWVPLIPGSPLDIYKQDLRQLKQFIL